ncbi:MAG: 3-beta hydroxysteroid dehydrogenase [Deltaproteobacteria bacterium]|nr:MAG: 3-beta hydroxysteroid dehydrogenase [Deltaproteobacteria bacterium]
MNDSAESILVTGGGGFLGAAIVSMLVEQGVRVRSFARGLYPDLAAMGVEQVQGDLRDARAVFAACEGIDAVIHTAAKAGVWGAFDDYFAVNVTGTENVIAACRHHRVARLIHTSSPSVVFTGRDQAGVDESAPYSEKYETPYPATKARAEKMVRNAGRGKLLTLCIRPHLIWGPKDNHLVPRIIRRARRLKRIGDGTNLVDTVYIDNAARAHVLAARRLKENPSLSGNVYFISQGEPVPLWEMVDRILQAAGKDPVRGSLSPRMAWRVGAGLERLYRWLRLPGEPLLTRFVATELSTAHWFNIDAARRDLGYAPLVSTETGLDRLACWLKQYPIR